jgi:hypothetical protein
VSTDGAVLAYTVWRGSNDTPRIRVRALRTGVERTLMIGDSPLVTPSGHLVFGRNSGLWAAPFNPETLEVGREPVPVLDGVNSLVSGLTRYGSSLDGMLVYSRRLERAAPIVRLDRSAGAIGTIGEAFDGINHGPPRLSPDGAFLAVCRHPVGGSDQVVIYDLRRGGSIAIGGGGDSRSPLWTPDGTRLTFTSTRGGTNDIYEVAVNQGAEPRPVFVGEGDQVPQSWTPDGQVLAFIQGQRTSADIWVLPRGGTPSPLLANPAFAETDPSFSLDGRFLAYASNESGRFEVYVQAYPQTGGRITVSTAGGQFPVWARDGLYYENLEGTLFFVPLSRSGGLRQDATPQRIMSGVGRADDNVALWDVSRLLGGEKIVRGLRGAPIARQFRKLAHHQSFNVRSR